ncbi:LysE family translocator [Nodosilinea sp. E11]|uniref:LysE family translocator n=1 Tax=Nodosilinea sp. E11 TaxID=3037479 RepID=UPI002934D88C|nr:LysE family transporter [Nodosilinea sp. E11]WOD37244.1 LysE family transporter [Nodosilinea sp. E11]
MTIQLFLLDWVSIFIVGLVAVITPGPDFVLTLRNSVACSRQAGIYTAIGIGVGNMVHASYTLVGIGAIVSQSILLFNILKLLGASYLVYLGIRSIILSGKKRISLESRKSGDMSRIQAFRIGFIGNMLNPKATFFFLALFTQFVQPSTPIQAQIIYGSTIAVLAFFWFSLVAMLSSYKRFNRDFLSSHWTEKIAGVTLIGLGLRLFLFEKSAS